MDSQSDLLNLVLRFPPTRPVENLGTRLGSSCFCNYMNMCRVKTKHIQLDPIKQPPSDKGQKATFKKVLFTVTDKTIRWGDCERNHLIGFDCTVNQ